MQRDSYTVVRLKRMEKEEEKEEKRRLRNEDQNKKGSGHDKDKIDHDNRDGSKNSQRITNEGRK